ncbi:MAG: hypothetical protein ABW173_04975 [Sphingomonas sp.]
MGGGAVHVVERQQARPVVLKGLKQTKAKPVRTAAYRPVRRNVARTMTCAPGTTTTTFSEPTRYAVLADRDGVPRPLAGGGYGATPVFPGGGAGGGFGNGGGFGSGGGFFGGFFSGSENTGGSFVTSTGGNTASSNGGDTSSSTGGDANASSGGTTTTSTGGSTSTSTGGNTNTSTGGDTNTSGSTGGDPWTSNPASPPGGTGGDPREVPAPPMVLLFGAAAGALFLRKHLAKDG